MAARIFLSAFVICAEAVFLLVLERQPQEAQAGQPAAEAPPAALLPAADSAPPALAPAAPPPPAAAPLDAASAPRPAAEGAPVRHLVQPGETFWGVAQLYGLDEEGRRRLQELNDLADPGLLTAGMVLVVPAAPPGPGSGR